MGFREINEKVFGDVEKIPFHIFCVYKWLINDKEMHSRFYRLNFNNEISFTSEYDWKRFISQIRNNEKFDEDGCSFNEETIKIYMKSYTSGFLKGYDDLDHEIKDKTLVFNVTNSDIAEFIFSIIHVTYNPFSERYAFLGGNPNSKKILKHSLLIEAGFEVGRIYKAWFYIISQHKLFDSLFKNHYINFYRNLEMKLRNSNSEQPNYRSQLTDLIEEYDAQDKSKLGNYPTQNKQTSFIKKIEETPKIHIGQQDNLSAFELALRHWHLVEAKYEKYIIPKLVGEKYGHLKDKTNIAKSYSSIDKKINPKKPNKQQLLKVKSSLENYPLAQKAIDNLVDY